MSNDNKRYNIEIHKDLLKNAIGNMRQIGEKLLLR